MPEVQPFPACLAFDHRDPWMIEHFYEVYAEMRGSCPVAHTDAHGGFWVVSRYEDVVRVMGDPESFSSSQSMVLPKPDFHPSFYPAMAAGETHREYRRFLNPHFSPAKVRTGTRMASARSSPH